MLHGGEPVVNSHRKDAEPMVLPRLIAQGNGGQDEGVLALKKRFGGEIERASAGEALACLRERIS